MIGIIGAMDSEVDTLFARMTSKETFSKIGSAKHSIFWNTGEKILNAALEK